MFLNDLLKENKQQWLDAQLTGLQERIRDEDDSIIESSSVDGIASAIIRRIISQHKDAIIKYGPDVVMAAAQEEAEWIGDVEEFGTSDASIAARNVLASLERNHSGPVTEDQEIDEAGRDSWDSNMPGWQRREQDSWDASKRDFKRRELEHELAGEEEAYKREMYGSWYIRINGKLLKDKMGQPYTFRGKAAANKAALTMMQKPFNKGKDFRLTTSATDKIEELSTEKLAQYKKAASADASAADKAGNFERGNKRFSGIIKATNKQFANDMKKYKKEDASPETTFHALKGLKSWQVVIMNNYYSGKYPDYSGRYYYVLATSADEAKQVVLDNADDILQDLLALKAHNGKKILPRSSAIRITDERIGNIKDGTEAGRMSTAGFKKMYGPEGAMMVKLSAGAVVDVQGKEQGVAEGGPFSYGAKKPRRGSVADLAAKKRKEQDKNYKPTEPKDQMVGTAKVTKGVAESYTGRETKDGTWRVFKDGKAVAVAGPFKSREEVSAWIKKQKQGVAEGETPESELERLKLRQNAWKKAPLRDQTATQARIRELEKQIANKKDVAESATPDEIEKHLMEMRHAGYSIK